MSEISASHASRISRAVKSLNKIRAEIALENPNENVSWYLATDNLNLMVGEAHDEGALHENSKASSVLENSSGGDW
jgi:hypothetical protein